VFVSISSACLANSALQSGILGDNTIRFTSICNASVAPDSVTQQQPTSSKQGMVCLATYQLNLLMVRASGDNVVGGSTCHNTGKRLTQAGLQNKRTHTVDIHLAGHIENYNIAMG
jgi:hypothetical protein